MSLSPFTLPAGDAPSEDHAKLLCKDPQERAEDHDVLLPRGGSWSSLSSLSYIQEAAAGDAEYSPKRTLSLNGAKRPSDESPDFARHSALPQCGSPQWLATEAQATASPALATAEPTPAAAGLSMAAASELAYSHSQPDQPRRSLSQLLLSTTANVLVSLYDLLMRCVMVSYYIVGLDKHSSAPEYLRTAALKQTRRYVESCKARFDEAVASGKVCVQVKSCLSAEELAFATSTLRYKHGMPLPLVWAWRGLAALLSCCPDQATFTSVTDATSGQVVAVFMEFRQRTMHHFITALVQHEASRQHGIYIAKYYDLLHGCITGAVPLLRLGPTTSDLKLGLGAVALPPLAVGSAVWARLEGRCSVVCFGIFTSVALCLYLTLTQWHLDASGVGALTLAELAVLYVCCMGCVKLMPLWSIGLHKVLSNPRKYLLQTSFYAQGVIPGAAAGIAFISLWRQASPLPLLDGLSLFLLVGEAVGRLGCHFYGCCFGRAMSSQPSFFSRWGVVYTHGTSSVARLRPEYMLRPLIPTQLLQSIYASVCQLALLAAVAPALMASSAAPPAAIAAWMRPGTVGVLALAVYSIGRLIFFTLRDDENFKSNRSYTTAYVALATLAFCAAVQGYSLAVLPASASVSHQHVTPAALLTLGYTGSSSAAAWAGYAALALCAAAATFVVQALHHHDKVGTFPDVAALLAPWSGAKAPSSSTAQATATARVSLAPLGARSDRRQIWSSWGHVKDT